MPEFRKRQTISIITVSASCTATWLLVIPASSDVMTVSIDGGREDLEYGTAGRPNSLIKSIIWATFKPPDGNARASARARFADRLKDAMCRRPTSPLL